MSEDVIVVRAVEREGKPPIVTACDVEPGEGTGEYVVLKRTPDGRWQEVERIQT